MRGSTDNAVPAAHLLAASIPAAAAVVRQIRVDAKTNEHKAALKLLGVLPLQGKVVTGDALFTHGDGAQQIREEGGDYLLIVKDNQPELKAQIQAALHEDADFSPSQRKHKESQEQMARTVDKGHGRQEYRRLTSTMALNDYVDWPDVGPVFALERVRVLTDHTEVEVVYGIASLSREQADAGALLERVRAHGAIENGLHSVKDETLGENRCRVRKGCGAQVLAAIRNAVVHRLQGVKASSKAAATRRFAAQPKETFPLLFT